jgi:AraC-like DNA-binding protein/ligand-binding sensor protein
LQCGLKTREKKVKEEKNITNTGPSKTDPLLIQAYGLLENYAKGTGCMVCVHDRNFLPIPEMFDEITSEKNICLFCTKYRAGVEVCRLEDLISNPCNEMHCNAMRDAHRNGGSSTYVCELGFVFWTSPLYSGGNFAGALLGTGYRMENEEEASLLFKKLGSDEMSEKEFRRVLALFPHGNTEKIKALAELLHICAEALSTGKEDSFETLRRRTEQQTDLQKRIESLSHYQSADAPAYPLEKEQQLLAALRRGDTESGKNSLNEILAILLFDNPGEFKYIKFRAIELVVLLSRADINPGYADKSLLETNNFFIKRIQESKSIEELTDILHLAVERIAKQIFPFRGIRHAAALRKAERFIIENYSRKISLQEIAEASGLSASYFSTIFKDEMGENLSSYLNRLRVEKAGRMLLETTLSLSEIAGSCGFEDQSWFSKIFKSYTGSSPGKYRGQKRFVEEISEDNFSEEASKEINRV